ncbi:sporulation protein [Hazenella sp. IB182357]|uniref:Sporulation protein n=1 Tax=Polycladospora coralii TaxID=2771432 RepID=A0A926NE84_9BACL|nr:sporulation protein [Polycladospora coralii]MBD1373790.1 sporulation protein [Polycladospora coralii]MBS7531558.1 sporulation protein [Polycladospora coralii]
MSIFLKTLASMGIGNAKVDTRLQKSVFRQGELLCGEVFIQGGQTEQTIDEIYLYLMMDYQHDDKRQKYEVEHFQLMESIHLMPHETKVVPFEFILPLDTPISTRFVRLYLKTGLDIKMALNPTDEDGIEILPQRMIDQTLNALELLSFQLKSVDLQFDAYYSRHPFVQSYYLIPTGFVYEKKLDHISVIFHMHEEEVDMIMAIDRKANNLVSSMEEALNLDERFVRFTLYRSDFDQDLEAIAHQLHEVISPYLD